MRVRLRRSKALAFPFGKYIFMGRHCERSEAIQGIVRDLLSWPCKALKLIKDITCLDRRAPFSRSR